MKKTIIWVVLLIISVSLLLEPLVWSYYSSKPGNRIAPRRVGREERKTGRCLIHSCLLFNDRFKTHGIRVDRDRRKLRRRGKEIDYTRDFNSAYARKICRSKARTSRQLKTSNLPVAAMRDWDLKKTENENIAAIEKKLAYPVVVKPAIGTGGKGVFVGLETPMRIKEAIRSLRGQAVVVEEQVKGEEYRVNVLRDEVIAVSRRGPPTVVGDGSSTVQELIRQSKDDRAWPIRSVDTHLLRQKGLTSRSVPVKGREVVISEVANYHNGGTLEHVDLSSVHPDNINMFRKAARSVGGSNVGIDYIVSAPLSVPYAEASSAAILEINSSPCWGVLDVVPEEKRTRFVDRILTVLFK